MLPHEVAAQQSRGGEQEKPEDENFALEQSLDVQHQHKDGQKVLEHEASGAPAGAINSGSSGGIADTLQGLVPADSSKAPQLQRLIERYEDLFAGKLRVGDEEEERVSHNFKNNNDYEWHTGEDSGGGIARPISSVPLLAKQISSAAFLSLTNGHHDDPDLTDFKHFVRRAYRCCADAFEAMGGKDDWIGLNAIEEVVQARMGIKDGRRLVAAIGARCAAG